MADDLTAALDEIRERGYANGAHGTARLARLSDSAAIDIPRLLAALDEVLKLHTRQDKPVRWWKPCGQHAATTLRRSKYIAEMEACPVCSCDEQWVCRHCQCPHDEWPCPTYQAITRALLMPIRSAG